MLISRGLQLEGQVVTEEQDLQVMVMTGQKNSPLQYLLVSAMQDRVRAAVAQSQASIPSLTSLITFLFPLLTLREIVIDTAIFDLITGGSWDAELSGSQKRQKPKPHRRPAPTQDLHPA